VGHLILMAIVLLAALAILLAVLISSKLPWLVKTVMTTGSLGIVWGFYFSIFGMLGFPVLAAVPPKFTYLASNIAEPSKTDAGHIDLWQIAHGEVNPRALRFPYSKNMHEKMVQAEAKKKGGDGEEGGDVEMEAKETKGGGRAVAGPDGQVMELDFVPPPNTLPRKGG
jgi:hypothetical protein